MSPSASTPSSHDAPRARLAFRTGRLSVRTLVGAAVLPLAMLGSALAEDLRLSGSSTVAPVMLEIGKSYEDAAEGTRVFVETGGSGKGIADLRKGLTDIGMISRPLLDDEDDLIAHTIAKDGIAVLVGADNEVASLTPDQVRAIFTGEVDNWSEVGGADRQIVVVSKGEGSATSEVLNEFLGLTPDQIRGDLVAAENAQMIKTVAASPGSVGYVSIGAALVDMELGVPIRLIGLGDVEPTAENVANGSYKATRPLSLVTLKDPEGAAGELIAFSRSPEVASIITGLTYVPTAQ